MASNERSRFSSHVLTICCVLLLSLAIKREFFPTRSSAEVSPRRPPRQLANWDTLIAIGTPLQNSVARLQLVEFGDFECPACKTFLRALDTLKAELGDSLAIHFIHFPLPNHRFARRAAIAAECAANQRAFKAYHDALFSAQDSLGMVQWTELARRAGIMDTVAFAACLAIDQSTRVDAGIALGRQLEITGTPTVAVNGWLLSRLPTIDDLRSYLHAFSRGQTPRALADASRR